MPIHNYITGARYRLTAESPDALGHKPGEFATIVSLGSKRWRQTAAVGATAGGLALASPVGGLAQWEQLYLVRFESGGQPMLVGESCLAPVSA